MNAKEVLVNVERLIEEAGAEKRWNGQYKRYLIGCVCDDLGIFDWWNNWLSVSQLKQMRAFLKTAISLGLEGYVCFKVGAVGCANGMWAHENESTTGYSPDEGACLYHSFVSGENYYDYRKRDGEWIGADSHDGKYEYTLKEVKDAIKADKSITRQKKGDEAQRTR